MSDENVSSSSRFQIFRGADAPKLADTGCMSFEPFAPEIIETLTKVQQAGVDDGEYTQLMFSMPGFSLTHVWFKKDFPLPLHSHDADCLYYIVAGSLRLGRDVLGPRDGFFIPANVPYSYRPGPDGVELLEIRHATHFNFVNHATSKSFWDKALHTVETNRRYWKKANRPSLKG